MPQNGTNKKHGNAKTWGKKQLFTYNSLHLFPKELMLKYRI
jgi:hypothetical protein